MFCPWTGPVSAAEYGVQVWREEEIERPAAGCVDSL